MYHETTNALHINIQRFNRYDDDENREKSTIVHVRGKSVNMYEMLCVQDTICYL